MLCFSQHLKRLYGTQLEASNADCVLGTFLKQQDTWANPELMYFTL